MKKKSILIVTFALCLASAARAEIVGQELLIERLLADSQYFGGCMALSSEYNGPAGCSPFWFSFDCDGLHNSKAAGQRSFEIAQMAIALEKRVYVAVESTETVNGYCVVKRIDLIK